MVDINYKIIIAGMICLTLIALILILNGSDSKALYTIIIGAIAMAMGIVIPAPKIDNKHGVLIW